MSGARPARERQRAPPPGVKLVACPAFSSAVAALVERRIGVLSALTLVPLLVPAERARVCDARVAHARARRGPRRERHSRWSRTQAAGGPACGHPPRPPPAPPPALSHPVSLAGPCVARPCCVSAWSVACPTTCWGHTAGWRRLRQRCRCCKGTTCDCSPRSRPSPPKRKACAPRWQRRTERRCALSSASKRHWSVR